MLTTLYLWSVSIFNMTLLIYFGKEMKREDTKKKKCFDVLLRVVVCYWNLFWKIIWGADLGINRVGETLGQNEKQTRCKAKISLQSQAYLKTHPHMGNKVCDRRLYRIGRGKRFCVINGTDTTGYTWGKKNYIPPSHTKIHSRQNKNLSVKSTCRGQVFSFSLLSTVLAWVCHKQPLLCWDMFSLCQLWWESLTWMDEFCQTLFSASIEMIMWFLSFLLLMWSITMIDLWILNPSYNLRINPTWSWCMILFIHSWIQFANIFFLRIFASTLIRNTGL